MRSRWIKETAIFVVLGAILLGCGINEDEVLDSMSAISESSWQQETQVKETEVVELEEEPQVQTVTISAVGDCALGALQTHGYAGSFHSYYDKNGAEYFFDNVRQVFEEDDFTIVNLEGVLSTSENRVDKNFCIKGAPEYTEIMTSGSVEACSLWNNHTNDYGPESYVQTKEALDAAGIGYSSRDEIGMYTTEDGIQIGYISVMMIYEVQERVDIMLEGIASLKEQGADIILACCHWGIEGDYYPDAFQIATAHTIIDAGADVLIGHHPHVLQGMEVYNGKIICYSLGNFCFGANRNPSDKNTVIYQQTFTFVDGEKQTDIDARVIPCKISSDTSVNNFQPTIQKGDSRKRILDKMNQYSKQYSALSFDEEGKICVDNP